MPIKLYYGRFAKELGDERIGAALLPSWSSIPATMGWRWDSKSLTKSW